MPKLTDSAPNADADGDGLVNRDEYAFGLHPLLASTANPIAISTREVGRFSYTRRDPSLTGLNYTVWISSDLQNWKQANDPNFTLNSLDTDTRIQILSVVVREPATLQPWFVRLQAE